MTNQKPKSVAPAETAPQGRELGVREHARRMARRVSAWRRAKYALLGVGTATGIGMVSAACGGSEGSAQFEPIPSPAGVCPDLRDRTVRAGEPTPLALNEALFTEGVAVRIGTEDYLLKAVRLNENDVEFLLYDKDGNVITNIIDQNGNPISERLGVRVGESWKVIMEDGTTVTVTLCGFITDAAGNRYALVVSDSFVWCVSVDRNVEGAPDAYPEGYDSGYGKETIVWTLHETGEEVEPAGRVGAVCQDLTKKLLKETVTFENAIPLGTQDLDREVLLLGKKMVVLAVSESGYIVLAENDGAQPQDPLEVGGTYTSESGVKMLVTETAPRDGRNVGSIEITVNGVVVRTVDQREGGVESITVEGREMLVAWKVNPDGTVTVRVLKNKVVLQDLGEYVDPAGNVWNVTLAEVDGSVANGTNGWELALQQ
ncbi:MAG: hypothetical protein AB1657_05520 [Candidatus Micrarchaeota archaeon]